MDMAGQQTPQAFLQLREAGMGLLVKRTGSNELARLLHVSRSAIDAWYRGEMPIPDAMSGRLIAVRNVLERTRSRR